MMRSVGHDAVNYRYLETLDERLDLRKMALSPLSSRAPAIAACRRSVLRR
jgi:hypothetical protein